MNLKSQSKAVIALDVGEKRIGVAATDGIVRIAQPVGAVDVDGTEIEKIVRVARGEKAETIVIGYPRNQAGEPTAQTVFVEAFAARLRGAIEAEIHFQDESLTSVLAEERLQARKKPYTKGDIDAQAATLILQDYIETTR